jgi:hypothetical protein
VPDLGGRNEPTRLAFRCRALQSETLERSGRKEVITMADGRIYQVQIIRPVGDETDDDFEDALIDALMKEDLIESPADVKLVKERKY